jgi:hypothetical protein
MSGGRFEYCECGKMRLVGQPCAKCSDSTDRDNRHSKS